LVNDAAARTTGLPPLAALEDADVLAAVEAPAAVEAVLLELLLPHPAARTATETVMADTTVCLALRALTVISSAGDRIPAAY